MPQSIAAKARAFKELHDGPDIFLMPNAWNAGSARILAAAGFAAIGTTSAGIAFSLGRPDYDGRLSRAETIEELGRIAAAVEAPVSADLESGYGPGPEDVAETIRQAIAAGTVGGSIEDYTGDPAAPLFAPDLAAERIRAARAAAEDSGIEFTLTGRAECYLVDHPDPFAESVRRANLYREAGADCLYVPGVRDAGTIAGLVREIDGPLNVVVGLAGQPLSLAELGDLGVRRVSIGGSLARATFATVRRAAEEMARAGTFRFSREAIPDAEMSALFKG
jgi:2-methylisocitrate lyase-like PEP mutase family enzyme